ncbi:hypothetical protein HDV57DRAFT_427614 [Trichoderma longibrachiatum]
MAFKESSTILLMLCLSSFSLLRKAWIFGIGDTYSRTELPSQIGKRCLFQSLVVCSTLAALLRMSRMYSIYHHGANEQHSYNARRLNDEKHRNAEAIKSQLQSEQMMQASIRLTPMTCTRGQPEANRENGMLTQPEREIREKESGVTCTGERVSSRALDGRPGPRHSHAKIRAGNSTLHREKGV